MQSNTRFIQDVHGAYQGRTQGGGKLDALVFSPRKAGGKAIEGQVAEAYLIHKLQAAADLFQESVGQFGFVRRKLDRLEKLERIFNGHQDQVGDGFSPE